MQVQDCSLNSATVRGAGLDAVVDLAIEHGFGGVGLWRDVLEGEDLGRAAARISGAGLQVSSVCRGGMFPQPTAELRRERFDDNRRAVDQAAALGAQCLVLVCGPPVDGRMDRARAEIADGITELAPHAQQAGVRLAIEPFHPMMAATRSAITSLREAALLVGAIDLPHVGLAVDSYHVWWETALRGQIVDLGDRILSVQVADWVTPIMGELTSRGMPGEGVIDMVGFLGDCRDAGYRGLVEVEVLSSAWWARPATETAAAAARAMSELHIDGNGRGDRPASMQSAAGRACEHRGTIQGS
ncbi:sugar phosphate isomerase/epimerase family protein [Tsukamurella soli]|uniref:Sugar phosphate isomerase/epimerase n=1 Tax=Tsukamurella soli TaxID=644556 RepID=A0ABP8J9I7_9ACTN